MKILHATDVIDRMLGGGTAARTLDVAEQSTLLGAEVTVLGLNSGQDQVTTSEQNKVKTLLLPSFSSRFHLPQVGLSFLSELVASHDVLHLIGHWSPLNIILARYAVRLGKPYVFCPAGSLPIWGRSRLLKRAFNLAIGTNFVRSAAASIAVVEAERSEFLSYGVRDEAIWVVPNGMSFTASSSANTKSSFQRDKYKPGRYLLFLGRLNLIKGPDLLLDAFAQAQIPSDIELIFAGPDNGMLDALKEAVERHKLSSRVRFVGFLKGKEKDDVIRNCAFLVIPSRKEAMSVVVLEAAKQGRPVLATDQCGLENLVGTEGGAIVSPNARELANGLEAMFASNLDLLGANLKLAASNTYSWDILMEQYLQIYRGVLNKPELQWFTDLP